VALAANVSWNEIEQKCRNQTGLALAREAET
jgi:hypothetical protein